MYGKAGQDVSVARISGQLVGVAVVQVQDAYVFVSIAGGHEKSTDLVSINLVNGLDGCKYEVYGIVDGMDGELGVSSLG